MASVELLAVVFGIALLDSLNPSALVVTLRLLSTDSPTGKLLAYVAGVFCLYLAVGVALMAGLDLALGSIAAVGRGAIGHAVQVIVGAAMLGYAVLAPDEPHDEPRFGVPGAGRRRAYFVLGATVTGVELTTALPYLAAVGILTQARLPPSQWLAILVGYNVVFVLPPLALLVGYRLVRRRLEARIDGLQARLEREARGTFLWVVGIVGFLLLADGLSYVAAF